MKKVTKLFILLSLLIVSTSVALAQDTGYEQAVAGKVLFIDTERMIFNIITQDNQQLSFVLTKNSKMMYAKKMALRQPNINNMYVGGMVQVLFLPGVRQHTVLEMVIY